VVALISILFVVIAITGIIIVTKPANGALTACDSWTFVSSVPTNASASMGVIPSFGNILAAALDGELYCFGGINQHERSGDYVWYGINEKYNIETGNWTTIARPLSLTVVACQNKIYSIGTQTQVYDPSSNTWSNRTSLPEPLIEVKANVVDDKIYVISGVKYATLAGSVLSDVTYVYDPELDSWSTMASIPTPVEGYASVVLDGKIYIMGGSAPSSDYSNWVVDLVQIFDPKTNQWTVGKPLPTSVYAAAACATSGLFAPERMYVVGGNQWYVPWVTSAVLTPHGTTFNQIYDPATGNWSIGASLPEPRWRCSLVNINDTLFVVGGENGPASDASFDNPGKVVLDIERYIPTGYEGVSSPTGTSEQSGPWAPAWLPVAAVSAAVVAVVAVAAVVYLKKRGVPKVERDVPRIELKAWRSHPQ